MTENNKKYFHPDSKIVKIESGILMGAFTTAVASGAIAAAGVIAAPVLLPVAAVGGAVAGIVGGGILAKKLFGRAFLDY